MTDINLEIVRVSKDYMRAAQADGLEFGEAAGELLAALSRIAGTTIGAMIDPVQRKGLRDAFVTAVDTLTVVGDFEGSVQ